MATTASEKVEEGDALLEKQNDSENDDSLQKTKSEMNLLRVEFDNLFSHLFNSSGWLILLIVSLYILLGTMVSMIANPSWDFVNGLYFTVVSLSTVGYGDLYPIQDWHKIFNSFYILFGVALVAAMLGSLMNRALSFLKEVSFSCRFSQHSLSLLTYSIAFFILFVMGAMVVAFFEPDATAADGIMFAAETLTTVGYGEVPITSNNMRVFVIVYILFGCSLTASAFGSAVAFFVILQREGQMKRLESRLTDQAEMAGVSLALNRMMHDDGHFADGVVFQEEFYIFCLLRMGRLRKEELELLDTLYERISATDPAFFCPFKPAGSISELEGGAEPSTE